MTLRRSAAVHEAGHLFGAWRYRQAIGPRGVRITDAGTGRADVPPIASLAEVRRLRSARKDREAKGRVRAEIVTVLLGPMAEYKAGRYRVNWLLEPKGAESIDVSQVRRFLAELYPAEQRAGAQWSLQEATKRLLRERAWRAIRAVAAELVKMGKMEGPEVSAVFRAHRVPRVRQRP